MSIRYWFPSDEEQNGALGVAITDEDGGFIAGTMKCFAGLALAGVLAANALAAQLPYADGWQVDERPLSLLVDETDYLLPPRAVPPSIVWASTAIFDDDSSFAPGAVSLALDESQVWTVTVPPPPSIVRAVTDDDQFVSATTLVEDESRWPVPVVSPIAVVRAFTEQDEYAPALSVAAEPEMYTLWTAARLPALVPAVTDDSDFVAPVATTIVDEDVGIWSRVVWATPLVSAVTDDDQFVQGGAVVPPPVGGGWFGIQKPQYRRRPWSFIIRGTAESSSESSAAGVGSVRLGGVVSATSATRAAATGTLRIAGVADSVSESESEGSAESFPPWSPDEDMVLLLAWDLLI